MVASGSSVGVAWGRLRVQAVRRKRRREVRILAIRVSED